MLSHLQHLAWKLLGSDLNLSFSSHLSFKEPNISRKYFCLCNLIPRPWVQVYFQRNKQICPNEVSQEPNRTVWDLDECLGPICFTFPSLGSVLLGPFWELPPFLLHAPLGLPRKRMNNVGSLSAAQNPPCFAYPECKSHMGREHVNRMVNNRGRSGCGAERWPLVYPHLVLLLGHASAHCHENRRWCGCALFIVFST